MAVYQSLRRNLPASRSGMTRHKQLNLDRHALEDEWSNLDLGSADCQKHACR
jgi:cell division protein FtsL